MNTKPKILVTGSNGQLGKELQQLAPSFPQYEFVFLSREDLPLQNFELIRTTFHIHHPQYVINCAAYTAVDKAESEKVLAFQVNGEAVGVLAAICRENNCLFIHISTDYVFDGTAISPYLENSPTNPQGVYGASKLEGERQAILYNSKAIIIRTSWVYSEFGKNFVKTMLKLMIEKDELNVVNDQVGSPTYAADLAEVVMLVVEKKGEGNVEGEVGGIYHYSNEGEISWFDFAVAIKEISGSSCKINPITTDQYPTPAKRPAYSVLDKSKIRQVFGVQLKEWKESLKMCLKKLTHVGNT
jgi:dTDP-4-dehydrorhamnose reductase